MGLSANLGSNFQDIFSTKPTAKFVSGARCVLKVNNRLIGFAFNISWKIDTINDEIWGIDDYLPQDIAPNKIMVEGTLSSFHAPGYGPDIEYMQANVLSFLFHKYITIEVRDSATDWLLLYVPKAVVTTRRSDIRAETLATISLGWKAIGYQGEVEPSFPEGATEELKAETVDPVPAPNLQKPAFGSSLDKQFSSNSLLGGSKGGSGLLGGGLSF